MSSVDLPDAISIANARLQAPRVASARSIEQHLIGRSLGIVGEPRGNVLELNHVLKRAVPQVAGDTPACAPSSITNCSNVMPKNETELIVAAEKCFELRGTRRGILSAP